MWQRRKLGFIFPVFYLLIIPFHFFASTVISGIWGVGVATQKVNLNQIPLGNDVNSLVLRNDGTLYYNSEEKNRLPANSLPQEGDVVVSFDFFSLSKYLKRMWPIAEISYQQLLRIKTYLYMSLLCLVWLKHYAFEKLATYICTETGEVFILKSFPFH